MPYFAKHLAFQLNFNKTNKEWGNRLIDHGNADRSRL